MGKLTSSIVYSRTKLTLDSVKKINLWGCDIDDISICKEMVNVQILSLSRNKIKSLEPLQHCTNLEELYIRGNEITDFNEFEFLAKCRKLKVLWIDENPCTTNVEYRKIIVGLIPSLTNLDDKAVSEDDHGRSVLMEAMASSFHESSKTATSPSNVEMSQSCYTPRHNYPVIDSILPQMTASYHQKSFQQQTDYGSSCYEINDQPIINSMMTSSYHQNYHNNRVTRPNNMMSASMMEFPKSPEYIPPNMSSSDSIAEDDCTPTEEIIEFGNYEYENNAPYEPIDKQPKGHIKPTQPSLLRKVSLQLEETTISPYNFRITRSNKDGGSVVIKEAVAVKDLMNGASPGSARENMTPTLAFPDFESPKNTRKGIKNDIVLKTVTKPLSLNLGTLKCAPLPSTLAFTTPQTNHFSNMGTSDFSRKRKRDSKHVNEIFDTHPVSRMKTRELFPPNHEKTKPLRITDKWETRFDYGVQIPKDEESKRFVILKDEHDRVHQEARLLPKAYTKRIMVREDGSVRENIGKFKSHDLPDYIEYNLDEMDLAWCSAHAIMSTYSSQDQEVLLGQVMNFLEKESYQKTQTALIKKYIHKDEVPSTSRMGIMLGEEESCTDKTCCEVCKSLISHDEDIMLICDFCNKGFHQSCYGIDQINEHYTCQPCMTLCSSPPPCAVCPVQGGGLKMTENGHEWCHINCAMYLNELSFVDADRREIVRGLLAFTDRGFLGCCCTICDIDYGQTIKCTIEGCNNYFHAECGVNVGLVMPQIDEVGATQVKLETYCEGHSINIHNLMKSKGKKMSHSPNSKNLEAKLWSLCERSLQRCYDLSFLSYINFELLRKHFPHENKIFLRDIYEYWKLKRLDNEGRKLFVESHHQFGYDIYSKSWGNLKSHFVHDDATKIKHFEVGYLGFLTRTHEKLKRYEMTTLDRLMNLMEVVKVVNIRKMEIDDECIGTVEAIGPPIKPLFAEGNDI
uniref:PHD-type domain-containing protein n=1 Tax=Rhabditophanes sp. KR3021 TaxID=114890 RepID=A0AC35U9R1_9BILA